VAIDSNPTSPKPGWESAPAIENEFSTYRAICPQAVMSLVFGAVSVLCFMHWFFLVFAVAAIVLGAYANRKIQRLPDVLTGRGLAQLGIALGLTFSVASLTIAQVQDVILVRSAQRFARTYRDTLKDKPIENAYWYHQNPMARKTLSVEEAAKALKKSDPRMFEMSMSDLVALKKLLDGSPKPEFEFVKIENHGLEGMNAVAAALYKVHGSETGTNPENGQFGLVILRGQPINRRYEWTVETVKFPYKPDSYVPAEKPVDDGHGHAPGEHH
jgi:hypothetical protein